ncbi:MAG TPA: BamA/TamA family outer membrane protein, partial [Caulobacteraceae bacterium]|nr:BamA/TamA family outer membrane protein [Caulobacteraceae bacterium]
HGFNKDFIFSFIGSAGYIDGWNGDTIRITDRFYEGGDTFRGFQIAGIGPRDTQFGDALGGKLYAIGTAEMTLPTKLPEQYGIHAALFTDMGTLGILDRNNKVNPNTNLPLLGVKDDLGFRASAGVSVFWKSPLGPLRFDFSQIIKKDFYDRTELFRFSTYQRF